MKKNVLVLSIVFVLLFLVSACGKDEPVQPIEPEPSKSPAAPQSEQANIKIGTPIIAQYFGIWTENGSKHCSWSDKFRPDTPFEKLNRLYIASATLINTKESGWKLAITPEENLIHFKEVLARMNEVNPRAELIILIGNSEHYPEIAADPKFAANVVDFLRTYGLNGIDVDWETNVDKNSLSTLIKNLATALHPQGYKLTLDVTSPSWCPDCWDVNVIQQYVDQINIMSYGGRDLQQMASDWINAGLSPGKIIGGIDTEIDGDMFDNPESITKKCNIAKQLKFAGMMSWRLDNDYCESTGNGQLCHPTYKGAITLWNCMQPH